MLDQGRAPTGRADRPRSADRPRWWAVLAVALALMALVASLTAADHGRRHAADPSAARHRTEQAGRPTAPNTTTTTFPAIGTPAALPDLVTAGPSGTTATTAPATSPTVAPGRTSVTSATLGATTAAGDTPGTTVPPSTTTTSSPTARTTTTDPGYLSYPGDVSAAYQVTAAGPVTATATWTGGAQLSLAVSCPGRNGQQSGPTGLAVSVGAATDDAGADTCTVAIAEPAGTQTTVSYSLTIGYTRT